MIMGLIIKLQLEVQSLLVVVSGKCEQVTKNKPMSCIL